jgi:Tol biopolymer transport system component
MSGLALYPLPCPNCKDPVKGVRGRGENGWAVTKSRLFSGGHSRDRPDSSQADLPLNTFGHLHRGSSLLFTVPMPAIPASVSICSRMPVLKGALLLSALLAGCLVDSPVTEQGCQLDPADFPMDLERDDREFTTEWPTWTAPYTEPSISSDGNWIVFRRAKVLEFLRSGGMTLDLDSTGIWIMRKDGRDMRLLMQGWDLHSPTLSSDGNWLTFEKGAHIQKVRLRNGSVVRGSKVQLTTHGRNFHPAWSPDGRWIAYSRSTTDGEGPAGVWVMNEDGREGRFLFVAGDPSWHPDGERIVGWRGVSPTEIWKKFVVYGFFSFSANDTIPAVEGSDNRRPRYAPNGSHLVFQSQRALEPGEPWRASAVMPQIWTVREDGSQPRQLTTFGGTDASWSPDGRRIVYVHHNYWVLHPLNGTIWSMNPDGSEKRQLTFNHGVCIEESQTPPQ